MSLWQRLAAARPATDADTQTAADLLTTYLQRGYIPRPPAEMLTLSDAAIIAFYDQLTAHNPPHSPFRNQTDSGWMAHADFTFINIRATGQGVDFGTLIQASKLLPMLRTSALHLAPFTRYEFGVIYASSSLRTIAPQIIDRELQAAGIHGDDQLRAFVEAAHMLNLAVGFDLEPHVAQYAIPVLMQPECFRWIKLYLPDKRWLDYLLSNNDMLKEEHQQPITEGVRAIVADHLRRYQVTTLDPVAGDDDLTRRRKEKARVESIHALIHHGYWPILSHNRGGVGVPAFREYHSEGNYPMFHYLNMDGSTQTEGTLDIATPFKFYQDMPVNQRPDPANPPTLYEEAVNLYAGIFAYWRDEFGFDFVRFDSVDHIFDSVQGDMPLSDRPTPAILRRAIQQAKSPDAPHIGTLAGCISNEISQYAATGFDLIPGNDMLDRINRAHLEKCFQIQTELAALNYERETPFAVVYAVDTHDTDDPYLWGQPLPHIVGVQGMRLRHFMSRFISCGLARRPKYETMATPDLSYGLHDASFNDRNLHWVGDAAFNRQYHILEDIYDRYRQTLRYADLIDHSIQNTLAVWTMATDNCWLIAAVAYENDHLPDNQYIEINLNAILTDTPDWQLTRYDFDNVDGEALTSIPPRLVIEALPRQGFILFAFEK